MTREDDRPGDAAGLRRRAEEIARGAAAPSPENLQPMSPEEAHRALHELHVHQIELEMQNEELRRAQVELDAARARYFDLYDLAPVGYCTVSEEGLILEANLAAASLLGAVRGAMVGQRLTGFIFPGDADIYYLRRKQLFDTGEPQACELRMVKKDGTAFWAHLEATVAEDARGAPVCRVVMSDNPEHQRAEEALRESEQRYRSLFENMLDGFAYCQMLYDDRGRPVDWVYLEVNAAFEHLTGMRDVVGKRISEILPGIRESSPEVLAIYGRVAASGQHESFEFEFKPISRWLSVSAYSPAKGYFVAVFDDITERKINEADRETMLALLRLANASNNTHELIRAVTHELRGWSGCTAVGIRLREGDDFPYFETLGFPAEFVEAENYLCARDANRELLRDSQGNVMLECVCGDILSGRFDPHLPFFTPGGSFWTNSVGKLPASTTEAGRQGRTHNRCKSAGFESVALIPLRASGRTLGLLQFNDPRPSRFTPERIALMERAAASLAIAVEQRMTQAALRESEEKHRLLLEYSGVGVGYWDTDGRAIFFNRRALEHLGGGSLEQYVGRSVFDLFGNETGAVYVERFKEAAASDAEREYEDHVSLPGAAKWFLSVHKRVLDSTGQVGGVQVISHDITERKALEAQLQQAQKMESIGRLAGGLAHDFNNLLTVINGYSQLLMGKVSAGDPMRTSLMEIARAGERAAALTRQLLAFSRKQVLEPRVLDLNQVVEEMRSMLGRLVGEDVEVRVALHAEAGMVHADPHQLEQVLMNVVVNARDAMPGGGKLLIETARVGRYVMLAVSDNGVGMDEQTQRQIFEPFFTTKRAGQGTGLGLSMVQGIVAQSGGYIDVYSEPGQGTTFKIYLPAPPETVAAAGKPEAVPALGGKETVLVVEDQAEVRAYAIAVLKAYGYRILEAENAGAALLLCERDGQRIDLVLTDVVMPNLSGRELAQRLGKLQPGIRVLFMSGYTDEVIVNNGVLEVGAEFIQKPFSPEQLAAKIRAVLGSQ